MRIILIILTGFISCKGPIKEKKEPVQKEKETIAKVMLTDLNDQPINLNDYKGRTVFINFWATWCKPCIQEMPSIKSTQDKLNKTDIVFLFASSESADEMREFEKSHNYNFNYTKVINMEELGMEGLPTTYIFDRKGELAFSETGYRKWDDSTNIEMVLKINTQK